MTFLGHGLKDIGRKRDNDEDAFFCHKGDGMGLYAVADGMGGHAKGELASKRAIETAQASLPDLQPLEGEALAARLAQIVRDADAAIAAAAQEDLSSYGMGTTLTLLAARHSTLHIAHVGDSRAYRLCDGALEQLTEDHTEVQKLVDLGHLSKADAATSPFRNRLTQAVGLGRALEVFTRTEPLQPGDRLLLCSDGLHDMLSEKKIATLLGGDAAPETLCQTLIDAANAAGGKDNITALVILVEASTPPHAQGEMSEQPVTAPKKGV